MKPEKNCMKDSIFCLATPKIDFVTENYFKSVFNVGLHELNMFKLSQLTGVDKDHTLNLDVNMKPSQIFQKILGSSVTSLELVITKMAVWISAVYLKKNPGVSQVEAIERAMTKPFLYVGSLLEFKTPYALFKRLSANQVEPERLELDFHRLISLLELFKSEVQRGTVEF